MLFNSFEFILIFLPLIGIVFFLAPKNNTYKLAILLLGSLCFYSYGNINNLCIMLLSIAFNFFIGKRVSNNKPLLIFGITCNLLAIGYYKYSGFLVNNLNHLFSQQFTITQVALPLGISFFTFQQIAYLIDTYKGEQAETKILPYALLVSFFPHSIAGPLVQYKEIVPQFNKINLGLENLVIGSSIFIAGLFKKVVIADGLAPCVTAVFDAAAKGAELSFVEGWSGAICYTLQLYFDFSGYSDMAIGLARIFNIQFPINFNAPYQATSIIDFWRRWHITLSNFLRNYVYIPLGGNRKGYWLKQINLLLTMFIGGLWHGANWTFIIWGSLHGLLLIINHIWVDMTKGFNFLTRFGVVYKTIAWALTMICVILLWVMFRAENLSTALTIYKSMFAFNGISIPLSLEKLIPAFTFIDYRGFFHNQLFDMHKYIILIAAASFISIRGKNLFSANNTTTIRWHPSAFYAITFAAMSAWILMVLLSSRKLEFLYFNF